MKRIAYSERETAELSAATHFACLLEPIDQGDDHSASVESRWDGGGEWISLHVFLDPLVTTFRLGGGVLVCAAWPILNAMPPSMRLCKDAVAAEQHWRKGCDDDSPYLYLQLLHFVCTCAAVTLAGIPALRGCCTRHNNLTNGACRQRHRNGPNGYGLQKTQQ